MPNCLEKITDYFYGLQILAKYMPNCSEKNYKLFLRIADLREIYAKLFTNVRDRTYQNAHANGCNGSEAQRINADNILRSQNHVLGTSKTTECQLAFL